MQLERNSFDEIADIICPAYDIRIGGRSCAPNGDCPSVGVVWMRRAVAFFGRQDHGGVPDDDWPVN